MALASAGILVFRLLMSLSIFQYMKSWMPWEGSEKGLPAGVKLQLVKEPSEELIQSSVGLFIDLMKDDLALLSLCGGNLSLAPIQIAAELRAGALEGEFYTAVNDTGDLLGYLLTMPPGTELFSTEEQRQLGFYDFMRQLSEEGKKYYDTTMVEYRMWADAAIAPVTGLNSWWIYLLMVREDQQGKGIGTSLVRIIQEKAAKNGDPVGVATSAAVNEKIYNSMGFETRGHIHMSSPWKPWDAWVLTRQTKVKNSS